MGDFARRWRIAVHEAGHEIAARVLGVPVSVAARFTADGGAMETGFPADARDLAVVALAGPCAEAMLAGGVREDAEAAWKGDVDMVAALLDLTGADVLPLLERADELVAEHRSRIVARAWKLSQGAAARNASVVGDLVKGSRACRRAPAVGG
ncbi:MAG: hypothetical protein AB1578_20630 [Thermodesulfobacteriota bacterium]